MDVGGGEAISYNTVLDNNEFLLVGAGLCGCVMKRGMGEV